MGERGSLLSLLLSRKGLTQEGGIQAGTSRSDDALKEQRGLAWPLNGQQFGLSLGCQVLQVVSAPHRGGEVLPALWGEQDWH